MKNKELNEEKQVLAELLVGIVLTACLLMIAALFFKGYRWSLILGLIVGGVAAVLIALHMYTTVLKILDMEGKSAASYARKIYALRVLSVAVLLGISINIAGTYFALGVLLGVLCLKFSAHLQPLTHKYIFTKFINKGR